MQNVDEEVCGSRLTGRIRVVERMGKKLIDSLGNKAPWRAEHCGRTNCQPCVTKPGSCRTRNLTYSITCLHCQEAGNTAKYWGESNRTWWDRSREHWNARKSNNTDYAIAKHMSNCHQGMEPRFQFKADRSWKSALERQLGEALLIDNTPQEHLMNGKSEWGLNPIPRVKIENKFEERARMSEEREQEVQQTVDALPDAKEMPKRKRRRQNVVPDIPDIPGDIPGGVEADECPDLASLPTRNGPSMIQIGIGEGLKRMQHRNDTLSRIPVKKDMPLTNELVEHQNAPDHRSLNCQISSEVRRKKRKADYC